MSPWADVAGDTDPPVTTVYYLIILKQYFSNVWILAVSHFGRIWFLTDNWKEISHGKSSCN